MNIIENISWYFQKRRLRKCREWVLDLIDSFVYETSDWKLVDRGFEKGAFNEKLKVSVYMSCVIYGTRINGVNQEVISNVEFEAVEWEIKRLYDYLWKKSYHEGKNNRLLCKSIKH